jgi:GntR family transcriptional regulator/MocR family aminotransferase
MNKTTISDAAIVNIVLDRAIKQPLFDQLVSHLRDVILSGRLAAGEKLPSSRKFAAELSVSRVTVVTAYDQLMAEGYIETRHGAGAFVAHGLPEQAMQIEKTAGPIMTVRPETRPVRPFQPTSPDMTLFPHKDWARRFQRIWSNPVTELLGHPDPQGYWPLRQQIAAHLQIWRAIKCQPEQVFITSGAGEAITLVASALLVTGQTVAIENPGYGLFDRVLQRLGVQTTAIGIDDEGMRVSQLAAVARAPSGVIITPSRQYPMGVTMPLARRLQMLHWLGQGDRFVIEDDYDSEYRYSGQPLPALLSLAGDAPVIYLGSFSKVFSKSLRLGYMVVPHKLLQRFQHALKDMHPGAAFLAQPVLASFMESGAYASHIRRMRRIYAQRQKTLIGLAQKHLSGLIEFIPAEGGMHLVGNIAKDLSGRLSDVEICQIAKQAEISLHPLSTHYRTGKTRQGIIAGYAGFNEAAMTTAIIKLALKLRQLECQS